MDDGIKEADLASGGKAAAEEIAEARAQFSKTVREINATARIQWDAARDAGVRAGIIWSEVKFQGTSFEVTGGADILLIERATTQLTFRGTPYSLEYFVMEARKTGNVYLVHGIKLAL